MTIRKDSLFDQCPKCSSAGSLRRSRGRNVLEQAVKKSGFLNIYRCRECGWRGIKAHFSLRSISFKKILFYIFLMLVSAYIIKYLLLKFIIK
jgi:hypothetical protein